jgi:hypothetical protein
MKVRVVLGILVGAIGIMFRPALAEACGCAGPVPLSQAFRRADVVFVGTVAGVPGPRTTSQLNADGSVTGGIASAPGAVTFDVVRVFRGTTAPQIAIVVTGTTCDHPFKRGERWVVYAQTSQGRTTTDKCARTRLEGEASQDLAYLDGLEQQRPQGIVHGEVFRRIAGADGAAALQALFEPLQVIAVGAGRRVETTTDRWGPYQLVLPPGEFAVWVEREGRAVTSRHTVRVDNGTDRRLVLVVEYTSAGDK